MSTDNAYAIFPPDSWVCAVIQDLMSENESTRKAATKIISRRRPKAMSEVEAKGLIFAAVTLPFPTEIVQIRDTGSLLLQMLWNEPNPGLIRVAVEAYGVAKSIHRADLLVIIAATHCKEGAEAFVECVRRFGWPETLYPRNMDELTNLLDYSEALFPALIEAEQGYLCDFGNVLLTAIDEGKTKISELESVIPYLLQELELALDVAARFQQPTGIAWRFEREYFGARSRAGLLLDLSGRLENMGFLKQLRRALQFNDPRLQSFAVSSLLQLGDEVPSEILSQIAASHESRNVLLYLLSQRDRESLFPEEWRTWDAFAAAGMVNWLMYPTELGREPDQLEKMAVQEMRTADGPISVYLWRFFAKGKWYAATSGPVTTVGRPKPCSGALTFSSFDEWNSKSPEEHLAALIGTVEEFLESNQESDEADD